MSSRDEENGLTIRIESSSCPRDNRSVDIDQQQEKEQELEQEPDHHHRNNQGMHRN